MNRFQKTFGTLSLVTLVCAAGIYASGCSSKNTRSRFDSRKELARHLDENFRILALQDDRFEDPALRRSIVDCTINGSISSLPKNVQNPESRLLDGVLEEDEELSGILRQQAAQCSTTEKYDNESVTQTQFRMNADGTISNTSQQDDRLTERQSADIEKWETALGAGTRQLIARQGLKVSSSNIQDFDDCLHAELTQLVKGAKDDLDALPVGLKVSEKTCFRKHVAPHTKCTDKQQFQNYFVQDLILNKLEDMVNNDEIQPLTTQARINVVRCALDKLQDTRQISSSFSWSCESQSVEQRQKRIRKSQDVAASYIPGNVRSCLAEQ